MTQHSRHIKFSDTITQQEGISDIFIRTHKNVSHAWALAEHGIPEPDRAEYAIFISNHPKCFEILKKVMPGKYYPTPLNPNRFFMVYKGPNKTLRALNTTATLISTFKKTPQYINSDSPIFTTNTIRENPFHEESFKQRTYSDAAKFLKTEKTTLEQTLSQQSIPQQTLVVTKIPQHKKNKSYSRAVGTYRTPNDSTLIFKTSRNSFTKDTPYEVAAMMIARFIAGPEIVPFAFYGIKNGVRIGTFSQKIEELSSFDTFFKKGGLIPIIIQLSIAVIAYVLRDIDPHFCNDGIGRMHPNDDISAKYYDADRALGLNTAKNLGLERDQIYGYKTISRSTYNRTPNNAYLPNYQEINSFPVLTNSNPYHWLDGRNSDTKQNLDINQLPPNDAENCRSYKYQYFLAFLLVEAELPAIATACFQTSAAKQKFISDFKTDYINPVKFALLDNYEFHCYFNKYKDAYKNNIIQQTKKSNKEINDFNEKNNTNLLLHDINNIEDYFKQLTTEINPYQQSAYFIEIVTQQLFGFLSQVDPSQSADYLNRLYSHFINYTNNNQEYIQIQHHPTISTLTQEIRLNIEYQLNQQNSQLLLEKLNIIHTTLKAIKSSQDYSLLPEVEKTLHEIENNPTDVQIIQSNPSLDQLATQIRNDIQAIFSMQENTATTHHTSAHGIKENTQNQQPDEPRVSATKPNNTQFFCAPPITKKTTGTITTQISNTVTSQC